MDDSDEEASTSNLEKVRKSNEQVTKNNNGPTEDHLNVLTTKFGHREFRPLQWDILTALMEQQRDVIAVMATGYGKSLCYQFPSVYSGGVTIVISPLISLMQDQVANLRLSNIAACFLGTAQTEKKRVAEDILLNKYRITYLTPEFCTGDYGVEFLAEIREKLSVDLIAIDEAHCISSWGHDFRPQFKKLNVLRQYFPNVPILALTATATPEIVAEITKFVKLKNPFTVFAGFDRPNLFLGVHRKTSKIVEDLHKVMIMKNGQLQFSGPTIIYCITRKQTEDVNATLNENGYRSLLYHSGLKMETRKFNHEKFVNNEVDILVATIAFGMGIDKPDVRNVVHYGCSGSLEGYYQEIGRAGRDGLPARCITFYNDLDFGLHRLIWDSNLERRQEKLDLLRDFLKIDGCRREHILKYFKDAKGTQVSNTINCCDNCRKRLSSNVSDYEGVNNDGLYDFTEDAKIILNAIQQIGTYNSMTIVLDFLTETINSKTERHKNKSYFGAGKAQTKIWWKAVINLFIRNKYISEHDRKTDRGFFYKSLGISDKGWDLLKVPRVLYLKPSNEILDLLNRKSHSKRGWLINKGHEQAAVGNNEPSTSSDIDPKVLELNSILLKTRLEVAAILKCKPYSIATNAAIMDLAKKMPITIKELEDAEIAGFNKDKFPKSAHYFVQAILEFCSNRKPSLRDVLLREPRVIQSSKLGVGVEFTYNLYKNKRSVRDIAAQRNLSEATVEDHLINCLKLGYDVKLSVFDVNQEMFQKIKDVFDTNFGYDGDEIPATGADLLPEFSHIQKRAVFWYIKIRKHLHVLSREYEEFDEFDCTVTEDDLLGMLVQGFKSELQKIGDGKNSAEERILESPDREHENLLDSPKSNRGGKENYKRSTLEYSKDEGDDDDGPSRKIPRVDSLQEQKQDVKPLQMSLTAVGKVEKKSGILPGKDEDSSLANQPKKLPLWLQKKSRK